MMPDEQIVGGVVPGNQRAQRILYRVGRWLIRLLVRVSITGRENLPASGPVVVAINHIAWLDPVIVMAQLERYLVPMAKMELFSVPLLGRILSAGGAIPVQRGEADTHAVKLALRVLKAGGGVLLAPEGTRSPTRQLQPGKHGAVLLALRGNAHILPVGITGTEQMVQSWLRLRRPPVNIVVGQPFLAQPASGKRATREEVAAFTEQLMHQIAALLPAAYRGVYRHAIDS